MKGVPSYLQKWLYTILILLCSVNLRASHIVGVDLFYTWVSGNTYKITLIAYGDCGSAALTTAFSTLPISVPQICIYDGNTFVSSINLSIEAPSAGVEITPVCPADISLTQCTNTSYTIPGIKKFVYSGLYTLPHNSTVWRFLYTGNMGSGAAGAGRAAAITNISGGSVIEVVDTLNSTLAHNSNPVLTVVPTPFFCLNNSDNYNPGAVDADGDSLYFSLIAGKDAGLASTCTSGVPVTYVSPYTATAPLQATSFSLDPRTGQIAFYPNALQRALVVYNIEERRGGVLVGSCQREMTFLVLTCTNTPPTGVMSAATGGVITDGTHISVCATAGPFSFHILPTEANPLNNITVTYSGLPTGATFTIAGNGTPTPNCTFSWNTTGVAVGSYTFYVTYTDNNCPLSGQQTLAYTVVVTQPPTISYNLISPASCSRRAAVQIVPGGGGYPWMVKEWDAIGDTLYSHPVVTTSFIDSFVAGTYTFGVYSSPGRNCKSTVTMTVSPPPAITPTATFTNPSYCGATDGTIRLYHLPAGTTDTIKYYKDGVLQPSLVRVVASDSTVLLTGLSAGVYSNITATYIHCVSSSVGPLILTNPPFTMRAISYTNPIFCGICNGTITLYGLRPGQTDTITYTRGGATQPPIIRTIGADSMVVITGLCSGVFSDFVARTAGICISNMLGPVTLTVPPFTMRALSFTNPDYCGTCNGTITLYGLHPGQTDSIHYTLGGVAQPPIVHTVAADSTVVLTGLCAGVYDNIVARTGGVCISNALGPVTLTVPPFTMRAISYTDPDYCGTCNGTITLYGLHPGQTDTITYTLGGVPQPPVIRVIGLDSQVVITGLCEGTYANFIAHTGGVCASNALGPVTLTVPPFTMRAISYTNPDYCGTCNGTITLYGLHPGQTDTITYLAGATPQSIVRLIGPDSQVVITGLCAGTYSNFVAHTGGHCVSNTLGPVTLTVPPFTMRDIGYTNPDYCGICNGTITLYGLHPGQTDTITYNAGSTPQSVVRVIGLDSQAVISGLCAGTYSNFVAHTGGICASNVLGPVTLTVPPFTMSYISYTNPLKCGFCNGTITLHGLHPGQTDTINYTLNGVPQPFISYPVGADSQVVILGLCEGTYANFVATTGGICVSNTLGPVTLVDPPITAGFTYVIHESCEGDTLIVKNTSTPASDLTYQWDFGDGGTSTDINPVHVYYSPGTFNIKLIITNTRCYDTAIQSITLNNLINAGFIANPDSFLCQGRPVTFTNTTIGTQLSYTWYFGDGTTSNDTDVVHIYQNMGIYHVLLVVKNYVPCFDTVMKTLAVDSISAISVVATDSVICGGGEITFTGDYSLFGLTGVIWTFGDGTSIANVNPVQHAFIDAGTYTVTIQALYRACPDTTAKQQVIIFAYPNVDLGPDTSICPGGMALVLTDKNNENNPHARWQWSTGEVGPSKTVVEPGDYYVNVKVYGCEASDTISVFNDCYISIPNVFTPNGDGLNDYFFPREMLSRGLIAFKMEIYNRWGQVVFETTNTDGRGWDGRFNGVMQPDGVFVYVIDATFKDGQHEHHKGNVTLLK